MYIKIIRFQVMKNPNRPRLQLRQVQSTKLVQRRVVVGGLLSLFVFGAFFVYWNIGVNTSTLAVAVNYTWTGTTDSLWNTSTNWTPNGVPTSSDNITIGTVVRYPILTTDQTVNNFISNNNGTLYVNGKMFQINGTAAFNGGTIATTGGGSVNVQGTSATFGAGATNYTVNTDITVNSGTITIRNTTFNGATNLIKTGSTNDPSFGNNTFNGCNYYPG